jgi:hypothetical protein
MTLTIGRRRLCVLAGAALIAPGFLAGEARAAAGPRLMPHDRKAARAEFAKIVAMFNAGDLQAFLAYGPLGLVVDKELLEPGKIPEFFAQMTSSRGRRDDKPIEIDSFARMKRVLSHVVYYSTIKRSPFFEEQCDVEGLCRPAGHGVMFEHWRVYFVGPRIRMLEQLLVLA